MTSPFKEKAQKIGALGVAVFPVGGKDGKTPLIGGYTNFRFPPSQSTLAKWSEKFPNANIGLSCGPSELVVVDIDQAGLFSDMLIRFGPTPIIVKTPSGGYHLWYRERNPVRSRNLRTSHGLAVDIKALGGYVLVPPSTRPRDQKAYTFYSGDWSELENLPEFNTAALGD